jgi:hypothetical protein
MKRASAGAPSPLWLRDSHISRRSQEHNDNNDLAGGWVVKSPWDAQKAGFEMTGLFVVGGLAEKDV